MHPFPPSAPIWPALIAALPVGAVGVWMFNGKRKSRPSDAVVWFVAGLALSWSYLAIAMRMPRTETFEDTVLTLLWLAVFVGCLVTWIRLDVKQNPKGTAVFMTALAALGLAASSWLPAIASAREAAARSQCKNNLHDLGVAFHEYDEDHSVLPPHVEGDPPASWRVGLLPYLDHDALHVEYDFSSPWDSNQNQAIAREYVAEYSCPSIPPNYQNRNRLRFTSYALALGERTFWPADASLNLASATDGSSQTLLLVEACGQEIVWTEPRDIEVSSTPIGINLPGNAEGRSGGLASSYHTGGAHVLMADGAVRFLNAEVNPKTLEALLTTDGAEDVGDEF